MLMVDLDILEIYNRTIFLSEILEAYFQEGLSEFMVAR